MVAFFPLSGVADFGQTAHLKSHSIFHLGLATVVLTADVKKNLPQGNQTHMQTKFGEDFRNGNVQTFLMTYCRNAENE